MTFTRKRVSFIAYTASVLLLVSVVFVLRGEPLIDLIDQATTHFLKETLPSWNTLPFILISEFSSTISILGFTCIGIVLFISKRNMKEALFLLVSISLVGLSVLSLKELLEIVRPDGGLVRAIGYSFPSGHAALSGAFLYTLAIIFARDTVVRREIITISILLLFVILIGLSRVYLGVHRPSEVVAGYILATTIVSYTALKMSYIKERGV